MTKLWRFYSFIYVVTFVLLLFLVQSACCIMATQAWQLLLTYRRSEGLSEHLMYFFISITHFIEIIHCLLPAWSYKWPHTPRKHMVVNSLYIGLLDKMPIFISTDGHFYSIFYVSLYLSWFGQMCNLFRPGTCLMKIKQIDRSINL